MDAIDNYLEEEVVETGEKEDLEEFYTSCREQFKEMNNPDEMWEALIDQLDKTDIENQKNFWNSFRETTSVSDA